MEINNREETYEQCKEKAFEILRHVTNETPDEQTNRYFRDPVYNSTIELLTQMQFLIETNEHFVQEKKRIEMEVRAHLMKMDM